MFKKVWSSFKSCKLNFEVSEYAQRPPTTTITVLAGLALSCVSGSPKRILSSPFSFIRDNLMETSPKFEVEKNRAKRRTIIFDPCNFLYCSKFSLRRFDQMIYKRAFAEEFLFNVAHYYDILALKQTSGISENTWKEIDPFGCITRSISAANKHALKAHDLGVKLSDLVVISTSEGEFSSDFKENTLRLDKFSGNYDEDLLGLMHFFINMHFMEIKDVRNTLLSYQNTDFIEEFTTVQRRLFFQRNLFSLKTFENKLEEVNRRKICEYKAAKKEVFKKSQGCFNARLVCMEFLKSVIF